MPDLWMAWEYLAALGFLTQSKGNLYEACNICKTGCEKFNIKKSDEKNKHRFSNSLGSRLYFSISILHWF